jgi:chemotaxis protein MotA
MDPAKADQHIASLATLRTSIVGCGVAGTLIGLVQMLRNMDDPSAIGPAMAVALLTAFYAVMASELFVAPMLNRIHTRSKEKERVENPSAQSSEGQTP